MPALYACAETINRELPDIHLPKIHDAVALLLHATGELTFPTPPALPILDLHGFPFSYFTNAGCIPDALAGVPVVEGVAADSSFFLGASYGAALACA